MQLVAQGVDRGRGRPDEREPGVLDGARERRPLGEEAVAGMDRLAARGQRSVEHRVDPQVALRGSRGPDADGRIGEPNMGGAGVGIAVDGDRLDPQLVAGADDPDGDLAAVGDEDAPEWRARSARLCAKTGRGQSGMLPCFFRGLTSRLLLNISRARMSRGRVSDGRMTSST